MQASNASLPAQAEPSTGAEPNQMAEGRRTWEEKASRLSNRAPKLITTSGIEVPLLATPDSLEGFDYNRDLGHSGEYPYTRGVYTNMYRGRLWTMRQFSGFQTTRDTNQRYKYLLEQGMNGLSVAFDVPTCMGYDSDDVLAEGGTGRCGVAVSSLADMEDLFDGIPLGKISTSLTINGPASIIWAMFIVAAEKQGVSLGQIDGTNQNDILKEYHAQKEYIFPPEPSMRLIVDTIEFSVKHMPKWHPVSISGCHMRETGATAAQELAFTLADGFEYVEATLKRGLDIDEFAPLLSFYFVCHNDFFEEIAKFRAARRIWAREMKEKYSAQNPRSCLMRFHTQTAGCSLTACQPYNNIVRTAYQAMAAVLGGTQSLHTNALDEAFAPPTEMSAKLALRTQQILAHETGVADSIDPLGGSYLVETLTNAMESAAREYFAKIEKLGGVIRGIEDGFFQREITEAAYSRFKEIDSKQRIVVGVNEFVDPADEGVPIPILTIEPHIERERREQLAKLRAERSNEAVRRALDNLRRVAASAENTMPAIIDAVKVYATLGEMVAVLKEEFGTYNEPAEV